MASEHKYLPKKSRTCTHLVKSEMIQRVSLHYLQYPGQDAKNQRQDAKKCGQDANENPAIYHLPKELIFQWMQPLKKGKMLKMLKIFWVGGGGSGKMTAFFHRWLVMTNNTFYRFTFMAVLF